MRGRGCGGRITAQRVRIWKKNRNAEGKRGGADEKEIEGGYRKRK
jgi:hypothetical protein